MKALVPALALALALAGCADRLHFRRDERLRFVAPPERALVSAPVVIAWRIAPGTFQPTAFDGSSDRRRGTFAVFVDRSPMRPGEDVESLAEDSPLCESDPRCPDRQWLADRGVYLTARSAVVLRTLPRGRELGDRRRHRVTVVLLDGRGRRLEESAWSRTFYSPRERRP